MNHLTYFIIIACSISLAFPKEKPCCNKKAKNTVSCKFNHTAIGKEKNMSYYQNLAKELSIKKQVIFTGPREDVDDFFTISDIFLFPTHYEPFGSVVLEAMNLKNVVFTTKHCGGSELLDSEFIMQSADDISVIQKINNLLENSDKLEMIKEKNRFKSKQFSIENNAAETLKIIDEIIN